MTKKLLKTKCQQLLHQKGWLSAEDQDFLYNSVFIHHPQAKEKLRDFYSIYTAPAPDGIGTRCFWIRRSDNSCTDISYITAIKNIRPKNPLWYVDADIQRACREAIREQVDNARERIGDHVHHAHISFITLVTNWIAQLPFHTKEDLHTIVTKTLDATTTCKFTDSSIEYSWQQYHKKHATLVSVCAEEHYKLHSKTS